MLSGWHLSAAGAMWSLSHVSQSSGESARNARTPHSPLLWPRQHRQEQGPCAHMKPGGLPLLRLLNRKNIFDSSDMDSYFNQAAPIK